MRETGEGNRLSLSLLRFLPQAAKVGVVLAFTVGMIAGTEDLIGQRLQEGFPHQIGICLEEGCLKTELVTPPLERSFAFGPRDI